MLENPALVLLVDFPILLPERKKTLRIAAWKVSGDSMLQSEFLGKLQNCWPQAGAKVQTLPTSQDCDIGAGKLVPFTVGSNPF